MRAKLNAGQTVLADLAIQASLVSEATRSVEIIRFESIKNNLSFCEVK